MGKYPGVEWEAELARLREENKALQAIIEGSLHTDDERELKNMLLAQANRRRDELDAERAKCSRLEAALKNVDTMLESCDWDHVLLGMICRGGCTRYSNSGFYLPYPA